MKLVLFRLSIFSLFLFSFPCLPVLAQGSSSTGNVNVYLGGKLLDEEEWSPVHEHGEIALQLDFRPVSWPINLALDFRKSASEELTVQDPFAGGHSLEVETSELNFGFRKIWEDHDLIRPFVEGGLSLAEVKSTRNFPGTASVSESDKGLGLWVGGGVYWTLVGHLNLGLEMMLSTAEVKIAGAETDAGGAHFGFLIGYHWGDGTAAPR